MADAERVPLVQEAFWRNEKLRHRLQLAEDRARRDPVWAEKMARRHAEFNAKRAALAAVPSPSSAAAVASEEKAALGAASICNNSQLALASPITCSTECPARENGATGAMTAPSVSPTSATPSVSVVHEEDIHIAVRCLQPLLPSMAMLAALDKPEGADTAMALEDEQPLACASVERQLTLVAARNVADDHGVFTGTSAMPFILAAHDVDDGRTANTYEVLLPLKMLVPLVESKELYVSPLLPQQFTQAMVIWGSFVNQLHATWSGMCSGATTHSVCLLPWDPGEKPIVLRDSVLRRDIAWRAYVKKLNADLSGSWQNEPEIWPFLQFATGRRIQFLPWDPGPPLYGIRIKSTTASVVVGLQGNSRHEMFSCSFEVETIKSCMAAIGELQPWPSFLDSHHVGAQILLMPCSLFICLLGGTCQEHPRTSPQIISLMGRSCSDLISVETYSSCLQCVHLQLCCPLHRPTVGGKLFLSIEGAQVDQKILTYHIHWGSETIQWEIAWKLRYEGDSLVQTDRFQICILALDEQLYNFSELSCCCQPWMSWQLQFFISAPRIVSSIYDLLISLKTRYELDMRPDLSLQPDILALGCCSIVLQTMSICSALQITQFPWFLASSIQPGAPIFLGSDCYLLIALIYMQQCPVWEVCFSFPKLQYYTEFGSTTQADQNRYRTEDYMESIRGTCFWFGTVGNASIYGSSHFHWYIAWANKLAQAAVPTIQLARPIIILLTAETLASIPGMQFLLGAATVHYSAIFQLEIAWELELECFDGSFQLRQPISLAGVSEVLDIIYAGINTLQNPWDPGVGSSFAQCQGNPEGLNDAWSLAIGNGYEVVLVRYPSLQVLVVLSSNGYVGRTTLYAAEESEWKIAWLLNLKTTTRRYTVVIPSSLETSNFTLCLPLIMPWDPGNASSIGDMQQISLVMKCFNHEVRAAIWQAGVHARHLCLPWDPGNSNQHRLEGKPDFKKGGLSATLLTMDLPLGLGWNWAGTPGSRPAQKLPEQLLEIQLEVDSDVRLGTDGFGLLASVSSPLVFPFLWSSSSPCNSLILRFLGL